MKCAFSLSGGVLRRAQALVLIITFSTIAAVTSRCPAADTVTGVAAAETPDARLPVPSGAALKAASEQVSASISDELAAANGPAEKTALAKKLMGVAADERDAAKHYALLTTARDVATRAGDLSTAYAAIDALNAVFAVDGSGLKAQTTVAVSKTLHAAADRTRFLGIAWSAIDDAMVAEQYGPAEQICRCFIRIAEISDPDQVAKGNARLLQIHQSATIDSSASTNQPSADLSPQQILAAKALTQSGALYLLDTDIKVPEMQRAVRIERNHMQDDNARHTQLTRQVKSAKADFEEQKAYWDQLIAQLNNTPKAYATYNQQVEKCNAQLEVVKKAMATQQKRQTELDGMLDTRNKYTDALISFSDSLEQAQKQYDALAADPQVTSALSALTAKSTLPAKLGPSAAFKEALAWTRQQRKFVQSQSIPLHFEHNVPEVDVLLNGDTTVRMVLDSGATAVSIPDDLAKKLGIVKTADSQIVTSTLADGSHVKCFVGTIRSIRLGEFSVDNVICIVSPPGVPAGNLLGGTFQSHFIIKLDLAGGVVHLSQLNDMAK